MVRTRTPLGCGLGMVKDWLRPRSGRGHGLISDWTQSRTGQGHGQQAGLWRGHSASKPRLLRGRRFLVLTRGKPCMRKTPSPEGNKRRQMRHVKRRHLATNPLPHFVAICHRCGCTDFVGRMVKGMVSSFFRLRMKARRPQGIRVERMFPDARSTHVRSRVGACA